jgi:glycosyltransferase involved in cell wall biosynthesis
MQPGHIPEVIYNPIDFERFRAWQAPTFNKQIRLSCLAANYPHKNLESIILATDLLRAQGVDATLTLIGQKPSGLGGGNFGFYGQKIANLLEGKSYIVATGYLSDAEVSATLRESHLFLFPSLFEGFGMPPVEILATGMPCLVSDLPVLREVTQAKAVFVQNPTDPAQWATSVLKVMENYTQYCQAAQATKSGLVEAYHCKHIANQYLGLIEKIRG